MGLGLLAPCLSLPRGLQDGLLLLLADASVNPLSQNRGVFIHCARDDNVTLTLIRAHHTTMATIVAKTLRALSAGRTLARPRALVSTDPRTEAVVKKDQNEAETAVESVPADELVSC